MQLADIYSVGYLLFELLTFCEPWKHLPIAQQDSLRNNTFNAASFFNQLKVRMSEDPEMRPSLNCIDEKLLYPVSSISVDSVRRMIQSCWSRAPDKRHKTMRQLAIKLSLALRYTMLQRTNGNLHDARRQDAILSHYLVRLEQISSKNRQSYISQMDANLRLKMFNLPIGILNRLLYSTSDMEKAGKNTDSFSTLANNKFSGFLQKYKFVSLCSFKFTLQDEEDCWSAQTMDDAIDRDCFNQLQELICKIRTIIAQYHNFIHLIDQFGSQTSDYSSIKFVAISGEPTYPWIDDESAYGKNCYHHVELIASFALQLVELSAKLMQQDRLQSFRCACHCGPISAGLTAITSNITQPRGIVDQNFAVNRQDTNNNCYRLLWMGKSLSLLDKLECESQSRRILISAEFKQQLAHSYKFANRLDSQVSSSSTSTSYVTIKREKPIKFLINYYSIDNKLQQQQHNAEWRTNNTTNQQQQQQQRQHKQRSLNAQQCSIDAYWLLNGPRLSANQSLLLASMQAAQNAASNLNSNLALK